MKDLAIVILNYNGAKYLEQFLPSVILHSEGHAIFVIDNCSTDNSLDLLSEKFPDISTIILPQNGGFAKGYNDGLKQIKSNFYLLLNSDIEVTKDWLKPLIATFDDAQVAGCQPKIRSFHEPHRFEHAGAVGGFLDKDYYPYCRGRIFDNTELDNGQYDMPMEIFWATGAALCIRSEVFHELGGFDEDFFAHMEEIDLCWRAKRRGWKFVVAPESIVYHVGGGTLSYASPFKTYLNFRNSLYMLIKNHEGPLFPKLLKRMILDGLAGTRFLALGEFKQLRALFKAHCHMYKSLPSMLRKRSQLKKSSSELNATGLSNYSILWKRFKLGITKYSEL